MCEDQNVNSTVDDFSTMRNLGGRTTWVVTVDYPGQRKNLKLLTTRLGQSSSFSFIFKEALKNEREKSNEEGVSEMGTGTWHNAQIHQSSVRSCMAQDRGLDQTEFSQIRQGILRKGE